MASTPGLAERDVRPTAEIKDGDGKVVVYPGPGLTVREYMSIEFTKAMLMNPTMGVQNDEDTIANFAVSQADALVKRLESKEDEAGI